MYLLHPSASLHGGKRPSPEPRSVAEQRGLSGQRAAMGSSGQLRRSWGTLKGQAGKCIYRNRTLYLRQSNRNVETTSG